jgi:hypothetical protein
MRLSSGSSTQRFHHAAVPACSMQACSSRQPPAPPAVVGRPSEPQHRARALALAARNRGEACRQLQVPFLQDARHPGAAQRLGLQRARQVHHDDLEGAPGQAPHHGDRGVGDVDQGAELVGAGGALPRASIHPAVAAEQEDGHALVGRVHLHSVQATQRCQDPRRAARRAFGIPAAAGLLPARPAAVCASSNDRAVCRGRRRTCTSTSCRAFTPMGVRRDRSPPRPSAAIKRRARAAALHPSLSAALLGGTSPPPPHLEWQ